MAARLASQALDLSVCPDLREFEFRMPMNGADQTRRVHWLVLCTLLQHISPRTNPKLQLHLILSFKSISWDKVKSVVEDLELMSSTLLGQLLRQVVSVDITIKSDSSTGGTAYIQSELLFHAFDMAFPRLVEEGRLRYKKVVC
ncbi:hypothetical protein PHLCEN_2v10185 [Hermanssonia centrifuga]|uniref:Uncharacterized protein n=1 Tax=Hermanssonia centrifuga TaxID=98765 RepID=A0A2R6NNJ9_9APHY|nr:hypothetical protein PHLCEN_2v10185 [Hermanssonia centrifuga]